MEIADTDIQRILSGSYAVVLRPGRQEMTTKIEIYSDTLRDRQRTQLTGMVEYGLRPSGLLEVLRAWFVKYNRPVYYQPKEFHEILRAAKHIMVPRKELPDFLDLLRDFLQRLQTTPLRVLPLCEHCLREERLTILTKRNAVIASTSEVTCTTCAQAELRSDLKSLGLEMSPGMMRQLEYHLTKVRSVPRVMEMMSVGFDPVSQPDLTLFDTITGGVSGSSRSFADLPLPEEIKSLYAAEGYDRLLPVQEMVIDAGLLEGRSLLVVSSTSSGKTLIGEMAGIPKAMSGKKMIYLSPLVALTNEKYDLWRRRYKRLGLRTGIKVGMSRLEVGDEGHPIVDTDITKAHIICATYEALDNIFRAGETETIGEIGTVVVDEIQNLADPERGPELDGLLTRLRNHAPDAQIVALSATVGSPEKLAKELGLRLVRYEGRPVPLERHLVFARSEDEKRNITARLVRQEFKRVSSFGNKGQSIVFTFSRRRAHALADWLNEQRVSAAVYHGGLPYGRRRAIENAFAKQRVACVVTTAALGAGVDLPASQVIFESLTMGADWLSNAEFEQMLGRAGRLGKHDSGKVYVIVQPDKKYHAGQEKSEDEVAVELLNGVVEDVEPFADAEVCVEQALALICSTPPTTVKEIARIYGRMLSCSVSAADALKILVRKRMITVSEGDVRPTELGRATSLSFFTPSEGLEVLRLAGKMDVIDIAVSLEPFENVYLSTRLQGEVDAAFRTHMPTRLFSGVFSDLGDLSRRDGGAARLADWVYDVLGRWTMKIFNCGCPLFPECDHAKIRLGRWMVDRRKEGLNPSGIAAQLQREFELWAYPGDIFSWLDSLIHTLKGVQRISAVAGKVDLGAEIDEQIARIERPLESALSDDKDKEKVEGDGQGEEKEEVEGEEMEETEEDWEGKEEKRPAEG
ncbi:MAG: DEAD/DEAH box helicase [Candidatus Thorarchaeota archaeon]|nr:DEAD/DEAH box helicase [Candidatus Thorarchaeota archaeon]